MTQEQIAKHFTRLNPCAGRMLASTSTLLENNLELTKGGAWCAEVHKLVHTVPDGTAEFAHDF